MPLSEMKYCSRRHNKSQLSSVWTAFWYVAFAFEFSCCSFQFLKKFFLHFRHTVRKMNSRGIENVNPQRFSKQTKREITPEEEDESVVDPIDEREIFGNYDNNERSVIS